MARSRVQLNIGKLFSPENAVEVVRDIFAGQRDLILQSNAGRLANAIFWDVLAVLRTHVTKSGTTIEDKVQAREWIEQEGDAPCSLWWCSLVMGMDPEYVHHVLHDMAYGLRPIPADGSEQAGSQRQIHAHRKRRVKRVRH